MTGLVGMDVAAVQQVGKGLQAQATAITQLTAAVQGIVDQLSASWRGQDAQQFAAWWQQQHRPALQRAAQVIDGLGQSALNNAAEQEGASSGGSSSATAGPAVGVAPAPEAAPAPAVPAQPAPSDAALPGAERSWQEVQRDYEAKARGYGLGSYGPGGAYEYQCTAWANFRWRELGYTGPLVGGNGWEMAGRAPGEVSSAPAPGAMASYGDGRSDNHVMVVERVHDGGSRILVSEMNTGSNWQVGEPHEYRTSTWTRQADGSWLSERGKRVASIRFAHLP